MWDRLTPEERTWKEKAAEFADTVLRKHLREYDERNCFPEKIHEAAHDAGLMNIAIPKEFGGQGVSQKIIAVAGEELATVCSPSAFTMGFNHGALQPILVAGTEAQKNIFVKDLLDRRGYASICLSEPDSAGSNLMAIRTRADRTADGWRITGEKCMVGNGCRSELFLVLADTFVDGRRSGLSFFAVPRGEGVTVSPNTDKIGFRCLTTPSISFREVGVPDDHRIGEVGGAEEILLQTLDYIRFGGTPVILGITVGALRDIVPFLETRRVFPDEPLIQKSHIQLQLGDLYSEVRKTREMLWRAADLLDAGKRCSTETAISKLSASRLGVRATNEIAQMYGWFGIDNAYPVQKRVRDARVTTIYEGTTEIQQLNLFRDLRTSIDRDGWL